MILPVATNVTVAWSACPSVALVHRAKAVGRNEMPFGGMGKMRLVHPPASGASSMVRAWLGLRTASTIWLGSW